MKTVVRGVWHHNNHKRRFSFHQYTLNVYSLVNCAMNCDTFDITLQEKKKVRRVFSSMMSIHDDTHHKTHAHTRHCESDEEKRMEFGLHAVQ